MADDTPENAASEEEAPKKKGVLMPLLIGLVLAAVGGGGGFFAVSSGLLGGGGGDEMAEAPVTLEPIAEAAFVALDPIVVNLVADGSGRVLRFAGSLDVVPGTESEIEAIKPRIVDVLNGYLRALTVEDVNAPSALLDLRAQMLRRVQVVEGADRVRDLLIVEFILN